MKGSTTSHKNLKVAGTTVFWLAVWWSIALYLRATTALPHNLFASPPETLRALGGLLAHADFWAIVGNSIGKIMGGYVLAFALANMLALLSHRMPILKTLLEPLVQLMKTAPVACIIAVVLIWISSASLSVLIAFFVTFPITYLHMLQGLENCDRHLGEMAYAFGVPWRKKVRLLWLPQITPYLAAGCRLSMGTAWKAGIAGEIIGTPKLSVGEQIYLSKLYFDTAELFAWTVVIIVVSVLFERLTIHLLNWVERRCAYVTIGKSV